MLKRFVFKMFLYDFHKKVYFREALGDRLVFYLGAMLKSRSTPKGKIFSPILKVRLHLEVYSTTLELFLHRAIHKI